MFSTLLPLEVGPWAQERLGLEDPPASSFQGWCDGSVLSEMLTEHDGRIENRCELTFHKYISRLLNLHRNPSD